MIVLKTADRKTLSEMNQSNSCCTSTAKAKVIHDLVACFFKVKLNDFVMLCISNEKSFFFFFAKFYLIYSIGIDLPSIILYELPGTNWMPY